ncbi:hypothetical protein Gasu2_14850 [Galdieria sulphuraria]|nr:hypothetical protein Gasu2_14850 [Galdieria sulphuraria]
MNFPRVRSILWDPTPEKEGEDATSSNIETMFTISAEQLLSSEWVWKTEVVNQLRQKLRERKQDHYFATIRETWCDTGNLRIFPRKLIFEAVSDKPEQVDDQQRASISLLVNDPETAVFEKMKEQTYKPMFRGFWLCELAKYFPPRIELEEHGNDVVLCLRFYIPDIQFVFTKISSPRVHNMEVLHQCLANNQKKNESIELYPMIDNFGFLSMNSVRKLLLYSKDDPDILERQPVVGLWMFVKDRFDPAMLWMACYDFLFMEGICERVLQNGSFLILLYNGNQQKYSILCCNCEAKLGNQPKGQQWNSSNPTLLQKLSLKPFSCHFTIPGYNMNTDIAGYLGLPVKIYRFFALNATTLDRRKLTYSSLDRNSVNKNSERDWTWKDNMSSKSSEEDITEGEHRQIVTKAKEQVENKKHDEQQDPTTKQQLQRLHEEMESLKKYFRSLGIAPDYKNYRESASRGMKSLPGEASKFWNQTRRPRSPSQEDISEDSVLAKMELGSGHIMSPVSSATDGDPKNDLFQPLKTTVLPAYGRQPNNSWLNKPRAKNRVDVAVQVDLSERNTRSTSQGHNPTHTNHLETLPKEIEESLDKVDEQVETDDLRPREYSHRRLEPSALQENFLASRRYSSQSSNSLSLSYENFSGDTKDLESEARSQGSSQSYHHEVPRTTLVNSKKTHKSCERRHLNQQGSTSQLLTADTELTVPKIIYASLSDDEDYDNGYSS